MNTYQIESPSSNVVVTKQVKNSQISCLLLSDDDDDELIPEVNFAVDAEFNLNFFENNTPSQSEKLTTASSEFNTGGSSTCDTNPSSVGSAFEFIPQSPPTPTQLSQAANATKNSQTQVFSGKSLGKN